MFERREVRELDPCLTLFPEDGRDGSAQRYGRVGSAKWTAVFRASSIGIFDGCWKFLTAQFEGLLLRVVQLMGAIVMEKQNASQR